MVPRPTGSLHKRPLLRRCLGVDITLPKSGGIYTIAALNRLPQWNTRTPILCFLLREMERVPDHAFFSAWRFEPADDTPSWANEAPVHLLQDHRP